MRILGLAGLALVGSLSAASATTMQLDYVGQEKGAAGTYFRFDGTDMAASAGEFTFDVAGTGQQLLAWCVDIAHRLIQTPTPYASAPDLFGPQIVDNLDRLFTQHYADVTDAVSSAAFQVAIWELVYDSADISLSSGMFSLRDRTPDSVETMAAEFLNLDASAGGYRLSFLRSEAGPVPSQNLVSVAPVPLPASAVLMLAGLAMLGSARRRGGA
ncbi:VPLPA-CTERM sorting domain-containing protein [Rhodovulum marinum]|uniref:Putative secreted protein n=1 Tax=Rhodovulum marinum TaxID=320662 RepID=A0A4R2Q8L4_9RHOB|nr:putative secreted protein [Rhodovulum marinum]